MNKIRIKGGRPLMGEVSMSGAKMRNHKSTKKFAVCIDNQGYLASLEKGKIYQVIDDSKAAAHKLIRVIDESGEDYAYPTKRFFSIKVPEALKKALK